MSNTIKNNKSASFYKKNKSRDVNESILDLFITSLVSYAFNNIFESVNGKTT
ncbi:hypothetical protein PGB90_007104 [Kerria lacca]